jgi:hypothetical protein
MFQHNHCDLHILPNADCDINAHLLGAFCQKHCLIIHNLMLTYTDTQRWKTFKNTEHWRGLDLGRECLHRRRTFDESGRKSLLEICTMQRHVKNLQTYLVDDQIMFDVLFHGPLWFSVIHEWTHHHTSHRHWDNATRVVVVPFVVSID